MKTLVCALVLFYGISSAAGQTNKTLVMGQSWLGFKFLYKGQKITKPKLKSILEVENPQACSLFVKGWRSGAWEWVAGLPGGYLLGMEAGKAIFGVPISIPRLSASLVLVGVSTWYAYRKVRFYARTIVAYNKGQNQSSQLFKLQFGATASGGLGLKLKLY